MQDSSSGEPDPVPQNKHEKWSSGIQSKESLFFVFKPRNIICLLLLFGRRLSAHWSGEGEARTVQCARSPGAFIGCWVADQKWGYLRPGSASTYVWLLAGLRVILPMRPEALHSHGCWWDRCFFTLNTPVTAAWSRRKCSCSGWDFSDKPA